MEAQSSCYPSIQAWQNQKILQEDLVRKILGI